MTALRVAFFVGTAALLAACVSSVEAPPLPEQATVAYGERLYLVDNTRGAPPSIDRCTQLAPLGSVPESETASTTVPFNCHVFLKPPPDATAQNFTVDSVEITNELYQLCVDSGACEGPDPSESSKGQLCQNEDQFDECPVVEVNQREASSMCRWIGRRLPSSFELLIARQADADSQDPSTITAFVTGNEAPRECGDAVLATAECQADKPRPVINDNDDPVGAAPRDVVAGINNNNIFDLTGNLSEWTSDRFQTARGNADGLPWFCTAALQSATSSVTPPTCPENDACVYGTYDPDGVGTMFDLGVYPVCITDTTARFSGSIGALIGGSWADANDGSSDAEFIKEVGMFSRRTEAQPERRGDSARAREYGFRCVGDRLNSDELFTDMFTLRPQSELN